MNKPTRLKFDEYEKKYEWLPLLLRAYYRNDLGTYDEMHKFRKKSKRKIACTQGCHNCCLNPIVPITQIEYMGISWYASEIINDVDTRNILKQQLQEHKDKLSCPFLVNYECSIYPIRPIACRQFHVIGKPCTKDENVAETRPGDIWSPSRKVARKTAMELLRFYGFETEKERLDAYEYGFIHRNTKDMHTIDWTEILKTMNIFDKTN